MLIKNYNFKSLEFQASFWNMVSSILNACQSAVMLLITTRLLGAFEAGIISIAYATGYLMSKIGEYGIRNFQVTDTKEKYKFTDYITVRIITSVMMLIISFLYCKIKQYPFEKFHVVFAVCLLKLSEVIEDVIHGRLQQKGRLDIAGKMLTFRLINNYIVFLGMLIITKNILIASWAMTISSFFILFLLIYIIRKNLFIVENKMHSIKKNSIILLKLCFPLFFISFLDIYITNTSKYAIDRCLTEELQGYFGILFMPIFTINLFSGIIYRPILTKMALLWEQKKYKQLENTIIKQVIIISVIAAIIILGGYSIGLNLLEIIYGISLKEYMPSFLILLIGGGMIAIYNFLVVCTIIIRKQKFLVMVSILTVITGRLLADDYVIAKGILGASEIYFILMMIQMSLSAGIFIICFRKEKKQ